MSQKQSNQNNMNFVDLLENKDNLEMLDGTKVILESQDFSIAITSKAKCILNVIDKETSQEYLIPPTLIKGFK